MNYQQADKLYDLALRGETLSFPNPMVGALIIHQGKIIGEGFHREFGKLHAEPNAIDDARKYFELNPLYPSFEELLRNSEIYVSLQPCSHYGKTPPCIDLILQYQFKRLIYFAEDLNPLVSNEKLDNSKMEIVSPKDLSFEIQSRFKFLNRVFNKIIQDEDSVWLTLKIATNSENQMITTPKQITNESVRKAVHRLRSTHQLLVTSQETLLADNPFYNIRFTSEELGLSDIRNPDIVVLNRSRDLEVPKSLNVFQVLDRGIIYSNALDIIRFLSDMRKLGYRKIMVEAGPRLTHAFLNSGMVDEIFHYSTSDSFDLISKFYDPVFLNSHQTQSRSMDGNTCFQMTKTL